jgi:DNA invertase Pin-like site-specific DNA recombinase
MCSGIAPVVHAPGAPLVNYRRRVWASTFTSRGSTPRVPAGRALFQMLGVFAELERAMIRERVMAGAGEDKGAEDTARPAACALEDQGSIRVALANGKGIVSTARELGVGVSTVQRVKRWLDAA